MPYPDGNLFHFEMMHNILPFLANNLSAAIASNSRLLLRSRSRVVAAVLVDLNFAAAWLTNF